ncbi:MAG TPA: porin family protein [Draconibacterium sp.]|nr:porin family protein [Draconibacterium sp.]
MINHNPHAILMLIFILFGFISTQSIKAQSEFGVKGGVLFSNINAPLNNSNVDFENKNGFSLGLFYKKKDLLGPVGFQTEFLYQRKGANYFIEKYEFINPNDYSFEEYTQLLNAPKSYYRSDEILHYFTVPLLLTLRTTKFLDIYAGPELGYLFSFKNNREVTGQMNRFSTGIAMGATLKLCERTSLDFRYSTDFISFDTLGKNSSINLKNYGFSVTIQQTLFRNK